jgi:hypothetical protein
MRDGAIVAEVARDRLTPEELGRLQLEAGIVLNQEGMLA